MTDLVDIVLAARQYTAAGFCVVPIPARTKAPVIDGWQNLRLTEADLPEAFKGDCNIGLLLGEPSGGLVDVDLDCPEAVELAAEFLPPTVCITGRAGKPRSHYWYIAPGGPTRQFRANKKEMLVELRSTGGQTVVGPSVHPDGDSYDMLPAFPTEVAYDELLAAVQAMAEEILRRRGVQPVATNAPSAGPTTALRLDQPRSGPDLVARAEAYLLSVPPAVSGQNGHGQTFTAATALVHGFGLDQQTAFDLLKRVYNPTCVPPWTDRELAHKVTSAAATPHDKPFGHLRDAELAGEDMSHLANFRLSNTPAPAAVRAQMPPDDLEDAFENTESAPEIVVEPAVTKFVRPIAPELPASFLEVPGFISEVIAYNLSCAETAKPELALAGAISLQATLAGRKVRDRRGNRTNLYIVGLASAGSGKNHARSITKRILLTAGISEYDGNEDVASDSGMMSAVEKQPSILFQMDEFGRFLATTGTVARNPHLYNVVSLMMKLYSSADVVFKGKAYADADRNQEIIEPCVNIYGTSVPKSFWANLTPENLSDGFVARLLVFGNGNIPPYQEVEALPPPQSLIDHALFWHNQGELVNRIYPNPKVVETTEQAKAVFRELTEFCRNQMVNAQEEDGPESIWARAVQKACRLALVYTCSANREKPLVDAAAAQWACDLAFWTTKNLLEQAERHVSENATEKAKKRLIGIIRDAGGCISRNLLTRKSQWLTHRERTDALASLVEAGVIRQYVNTDVPTKPVTVCELLEIRQEISAQ